MKQNHFELTDIRIHELTTRSTGQDELMLELMGQRNSDKSPVTISVPRLRRMHVSDLELPADLAEVNLVVMRDGSYYGYFSSEMLSDISFESVNEPTIRISIGNSTWVSKFESKKRRWYTSNTYYTVTWIQE